LPANAQTFCVPPPPKLDETDHALLELLQRDSSATLFELGQEVGLSTSAVQRRIGRYRAAGLIDREVAVLDAARFPDVVLGLVMVTLDRESTRHHSDLQKRLLASPAVQQSYDLAGEYDYAVLLAARGMNALREVVEDLFMDAPNLKRFDTFMVYRIIKAGLELPTT
jgi:Lrp/AsnC family leucine-responsive transcriptional regulator